MIPVEMNMLYYADMAQKICIHHGAPTVENTTRQTPVIVSAKKLPMICVVDEDDPTTR